MQEDNHLSYDFIYINQLPFWTTLLEEQPDPLDDFRRASSVFYDSHGSRTRFFEIWCVGGKPAHTGIGVRDGGGNRLIHFVRQRSSQLSHGGHPVHVREVCLRLTQSLALFIRPLAFGHVYRCTDVFQEIAGYVTNGMPCRANVFNCSVRKNDSEFDVKVGAFVRPFKKNFPAHPISILWMNAPVKRFV